MKKGVRVLRPVYPGYLFIRNSVGAREVVNLPVRVWWVRNYDGQVAEVSSRVIESIRKLEGQGELVREIRHASPWRTGVRVYVHIDVADLQAIIVKVAGNRALVDLPPYKCWVQTHRLELM
jgi:hypothetical protein